MNDQTSYMDNPSLDDVYVEDKDSEREDHHREKMCLQETIQSLEQEVIKLQLLNNHLAVVRSGRG